MSIPAIDLDSLTPDEQLDLVEQLWDRLSRRPEALPLSEELRRELDAKSEELFLHITPQTPTRTQASDPFGLPLTPAWFERQYAPFVRSQTQHPRLPPRSPTKTPGRRTLPAHGEPKAGVSPLIPAARFRIGLAGGPAVRGGGHPMLRLNQPDLYGIAAGGDDRGRASRNSATE